MTETLNQKEAFFGITIPPTVDGLILECFPPMTQMRKT